MSAQAESAQTIEDAAARAEASADVAGVTTGEAALEQSNDGGLPSLRSRLEPIEESADSAIQVPEIPRHS